MSLPEGWGIADVASLNACPVLTAREIRRVVESGVPAAELRAAGPKARRERLALDEEGEAALAGALAAGEGEREVSEARERGIGARLLWEEGYPPLLKEIPDPPPLLWAWGSIPEAPALGVVGTRHPSLYGREQGERFGRELARIGFAVISGLARGVDAAAHRGALSTGTTVAVLGSGLLEPYPPEHAPLADRIAKGGAVVSEFPLRAPPHAYHFPRRNRIIAGLSRGVVVVEASPKSGSLITAGLALDQGREVFAVPGRVDQPNSHGCHALIQAGAKLAAGPEDVLDEMGPEVLEELRRSARASDPAAGPGAPTPGRRTPDEARLLSVLSEGELPVDRIVDLSGLPAGRVLSLLLLLELRREIVRAPGNVYGLASAHARAAGPR